MQRVVARLVVAAVVCLFVPLSACGTVERTMLSSDDARPVRSSEGYPMIWDADGRSYTLVPAANKILLSTGEEIELSTEQTEQMLNAFVAYNLDGGSYLEAAMAAAPLPPRLDTMKAYSRIPLPTSLMESVGAPCTGRSLLAAPMATAARTPMRLIDTRASLAALGGADGQPPWRFRQKTDGRAVAAHSPRPGDARQMDVIAVDSITGASCWQIAREIYRETQDWKVKKTVWHASIVALLPYFQWDSSIGKFVYKQAFNEAKSTAFLVATEVFKQADVQLNIIAVMYKQQGCLQNTWPDATTAARVTPTGVSYSCHKESAELSVDGGATWTPVIVTVCDLKVA